MLGASPPLQIKHLGTVDYGATLKAMQDFTLARGPNTPDELWICEHPPVYTLGLSGHRKDLHQDLGFSLVQTNRGGQITYHGPGQVLAYPLLDLARRGYFVKEYVHRLEESVIKCLNAWGLSAYRVPGAPGVYANPQDPQGHATWPTLLQRWQDTGHPLVDPPGVNFAGLAKIAALGIKVSRHCTYHGVALNVAMDLAPFGAIHPCGHPGLQVTDLRHLGLVLNSAQVAQDWAQKLALHLAA